MAENPAGQLAFGGTGEDVLRADGGRAHLYGGHGDDRVLGGRFADGLVGGLGNDVLIGYGGPDTLHGRGGADDLYGYTGDDRLHGGGGLDESFGGTGIDACQSPGSGTNAHSCGVSCKHVRLEATGHGVLGPAQPTQSGHLCASPYEERIVWRPRYAFDRHVVGPRLPRRIPFSTTT